ncbi:MULTISPECIES: efflux RND transporter periplasmic adaptor subunit [Streptococcus]|jgi:efflux transporter, RND family, MFP subunit|uniref:Efflux transporter periplasmic adaptor subunit n=1 Tax=Streptococcus oralis subsp. oralis TaxID=1891914 RepID=A0ABD6RGG1_STROR|nr:MULTISPECIES: efflux RND transporter periplasmic adaptor subunit [Streptococcus]EIC77314.1 efflux transporter, RND family, MFP subunit [Streptococcus oralis SK100]KZX05942.1 efflux transporter periplasmic adaptor subunit [Streptococcus oralis]MBK3298136.1 efflux RND transporter periplasmic adaptor subunit [Streptococcus oralis]MBS9396530.1 efflux RND transporter periplasmic adaptor subunit [Streptococcus oralis]MBS9406121.1 efflux RND transporter periplasmic adaptor subunit [Streptococcus o
MKRNKKAKKWQLYTAIGIASVIVIGAAGILIFRQPSQSAVKEETSHIVTAKEGSVASSVLLSGTVTAKNEQYVYFDASKGDLDEILVSVGDKVEEGQALVKYSSADAQAAYDAADRAVAKADRHIEELNKARENASATPASSQVPTEAGLPEQAQAATSSVSSIDSQISDAKDNRADAVAQLNKAQAQLDAATVLSTLEGTVVEVNRNVSKSPTGNSQVVVHVVSNENLQVKGELSEYNLANLSVGQEVTFTSKVYQDKSWTGKISYISDYPKNNGEAANAALGGNTGSKYPYTVDVTSDIGELKQGFSVSVEVKNKSKAILVPLTSVVTENDKNYVWIVDEQKKAKKVEVTLGNADADNQEITSGLTDGAKVISNPTSSLEEGKEVKADEETN